MISARTYYFLGYGRTTRVGFPLLIYKMPKYNTSLRDYYRKRIKGRGREVGGGWWGWCLVRINFIKSV